MYSSYAICSRLNASVKVPEDTTKPIEINITNKSELEKWSREPDEESDYATSEGRYEGAMWLLSALDAFYGEYGGDGAVLIRYAKELCGKK